MGIKLIKKNESFESDLENIAQTSGEIDYADAWKLNRAATKGSEHRKNVRNLIGDWRSAAEDGDEDGMTKAAKALKALADFLPKQEAHPTKQASQIKELCDMCRKDKQVADAVFKALTRDYNTSLDPVLAGQYLEKTWHGKLEELGGCNGWYDGFKKLYADMGVDFICSVLQDLKLGASDIGSGACTSIVRGIYTKLAEKDESGTTYDEYVNAVAASLEDDFEYSPITALEFAQDDFKEITKACYSATKSPYDAAKAIDAEYMGGNESRKAEGREGWDNWEQVEGLEDAIEGVENLAYELRSCVRGAKTRCKDWKALGAYIQGLGNKLVEAGEEMQYINDGDDADESKKKRKNPSRNFSSTVEEDEDGIKKSH